jgi:hypothetical protein
MGTYHMTQKKVAKGSRSLSTNTFVRETTINTALLACRMTRGVHGTVTTLTTLFFGMILGCSDGNGPPEDKNEYVTVTTLGATCGSWQTEPSGTSGAARLYSTCGEGLICGHLVSSRPPYELERRLV